MAESSSEPIRESELTTQEHVGRGVDVVGEGQRLVDRLDAEGLGVSRVADRHGLAVDQDLAGIGRVGAGERADQRRLAGAVAADEADDLAGVEVDGDAVDGVDAAERDEDVAHLDERHAGAGGRRPGAGRGCRDARRVARSRGHGGVDHHLLLAAHADRRRMKVSNPTATTSTTPTTMSWVGESTLSRTMPDRSDCMTTAPRMAPGIVPMPPGERRPADDGRRDHVQLVLDAEVRDGGVEAGRLDRRADRAEDAHQDERPHDRPAHVDTAELGGVGVAADREHVAAEPPPGREVGHRRGRRRAGSGPGSRCRSE